MIGPMWMIQSLRSTQCLSNTREGSTVFNQHMIMGGVVFTEHKNIVFNQHMRGGGNTVFNQHMNVD